MPTSLLVILVPFVIDNEASQQQSLYLFLSIEEAVPDAKIAAIGRRKP